MVPLLWETFLKNFLPREGLLLEICDFVTFTTLGAYPGTKKDSLTRERKKLSKSQKRKYFCDFL